MLRCGQGDRLGNFISLLDVLVLAELNYILGMSIFANTLEINQDLRGKFIVIDSGFSWISVVVRWDFSGLNIHSC